MTHPKDSRAAWPWIAVVVLASLLLSRAFACATPFAALAVLAALTLRERDAVVLVLATWLGNQAIGFGWMHYPWDASTLGWGAAIGLAALVALATARGARLGSASLPSLAQAAIALVAAYAAYELALFAATAFLPSGGDAFMATVVFRIFIINAVALALLLAARSLALAAGVRTSSLART